MKKIYFSNIISFFMIISLLLIVFSCTKKEKEPTAEEPVSAAPVQRSIERTGNQESGKQPGTRPEETIRKASAGEPKGRDYLLYQKTTTDGIIASDFKIGELQSGLADDEQSADILETAEAFLNSLVENNPDIGLISSIKKSYVERIIADELENPVFSDFRIGIIDTVSDPPRAAIRILGQDGWSRGEMYFVREDGWKIYDVHIDFLADGGGGSPDTDRWEPDDIKK